MELRTCHRELDGVTALVPAETETEVHSVVMVLVEEQGTTLMGRGIARWEVIDQLTGLKVETPHLNTVATPRIRPTVGSVEVVLMVGTREGVVVGTRVETQLPITKTVVRTVEQRSFRRLRRPLHMTTTRQTTGM